jgi:IS605 OrfB family transposase
VVPGDDGAERGVVDVHEHAVANRPIDDLVSISCSQGKCGSSVGGEAMRVMHAYPREPGPVTAGRLAEAQRDLARKKRGSNRRKKATVKVALLHGKVRRQRLDHAHKTALTLVRGHDLIVREDLKIKNMTARPKPRPDGSGGHKLNGSAAKAGLNKSIQDAGWGIFLRVLSAKAESAGRAVIAVNPVTPPSGAPNAATSLQRTASPRRSSDVSPAATRPTPTSTPPGTY